VRNAGARPGDQLVLTKPLGIGIITTGIDRALVAEETVARVTRVMTSLNREAADAMCQIGIRTATDITGFGLLGHLHEMLTASGVGARVWLDRVPVLEEAWGLAAEACIPEGSHNNARYLQDVVTWAPEIPPEAQIILCDAQTPGGLLMAVPPAKVASLLAALAQTPTSGTVIGEVTAEPKGRIQVATQNAGRET